MSAFLLKNEAVGYRILHGSDTDVSSVTIVKLGPDIFVETTYWFPEEPPFLEKHVQVRVLSREDLDKLFELQYGAPMHFINKDDYEEFIK